jgi:hypothetical protein
MFQSGLTVAGVLAALSASASAETQSIQNLFEQGYTISSMQVINAGGPGLVGLVLTKQTVMPSWPSTKAETSLFLCLAAVNAEAAVRMGLEIGCRPLNYVGAELA